MNECLVGFALVQSVTVHIQPMFVTGDIASLEECTSITVTIPKPQPRVVTSAAAE
eukprot:m.167266 g.167266  ORF g.167266 m.167266 type:complete len:55 (-) comp14455_c0_seq6:195-359(-)